MNNKNLPFIRCDQWSFSQTAREVKKKRTRRYFSHILLGVSSWPHISASRAASRFVVVRPSTSVQLLTDRAVTILSSRSPQSEEETLYFSSSSFNELYCLRSLPLTLSLATQLCVHARTAVARTVGWVEGRDCLFAVPKGTKYR